MAALERTYVVPLRREFQKVATYKKSKKATKAVKEFIVRHMKAADFNAVKLLNELNQELWKHGIRNPPHKVKVVCRRDDKGVVMVQLFGQPFPESAKVEEKKSGIKKMTEKITGKKEESHEGHDHAGHTHEAPKAPEKKEAPKPAAPKPAPAKPAAPSQKPNQEQKR